MELNNLNWGIYNTYVNFEICILTAKNVEKRKENIRNTFFNFASPSTASKSKVLYAKFSRD